MGAAAALIYARADVNRSSDPCILDNGQHSLLADIAKHGLVQTTRALLDAGISPDAKIPDESGHSWFTHSLLNGHVRIATLLLEARANPHHQIEGGNLLTAAA